MLLARAYEVIRKVGSTGSCLLDSLSLAGRLPLSNKYEVRLYINCVFCM